MPLTYLKGTLVEVNYTCKNHDGAKGEDTDWVILMEIF